jgi:uncharacterized protein YecE (DUF72 family)
MIRIGPAGWSYPDWRGVVYPQRKPKGFHETAYLAEYFDTIELNVSFYRPITAKTAEGWLGKLEGKPDFRFTAKLWRGFTHERNTGPEDERLVREGFAPLIEANRMGAVLLQFPWSFRYTPENRDYLARLRGQFADYPLVLEVRHASWNEPGVLDMLEQLGVGLCNIDQPLFKRSIAPGAASTSPIGYVRLHGRNYKAWFTENKYQGERYDYLYGVGELEPWVDRIKAVAHATQDTYVVTNNHYLGKGLVNATEIASLIKGSPVPAPQLLIEHYPELREFTTGGEGDALPLFPQQISRFALAARMP